MQDDTDGTTKENSEAKRETAVGADACREATVNEFGIDPFDEEERDPLRSNAMSKLTASAQFPDFFTFVLFEKTF